MSEERHAGKPFRALGNKLRSVREAQKQSLAEVSGAVEIDDEMLEKIEAGEQRPSEDILMLIISHFGLQDDDATGLWELAGYTDGKSGDQRQAFELNQPIAMLMPMDARIVYTDMVHVMVNDFGVVMNFMQNNGNGSQPLAIARVGMSKEHAQSVLELLQKSLQPSTKHPKSLPAPVKAKEDKSKKQADK